MRKKDTIKSSVIAYFFIMGIAYGIIGYYSYGVISNLPSNKIKAEIGLNANKSECVDKYIEDFRENEYWGIWIIKHKLIQSENIVSRFDEETLNKIPHKTVEDVVRYADINQPYGACVEESIFGYSLLNIYFPEKDIRIVAGTTNMTSYAANHAWLIVDGKEYPINGWEVDETIPYFYMFNNRTASAFQLDANRTNIMEYICGDEE